MTSSDKIFAQSRYKNCQILNGRVLDYQRLLKWCQKRKMSPTNWSHCLQGELSSIPPPLARHFSANFQPKWKKLEKIGGVEKFWTTTAAAVADAAPHKNFLNPRFFLDQSWNERLKMKAKLDKGRSLRWRIGNGGLGSLQQKVKKVCLLRLFSVANLVGEWSAIIHYNAT